MSAQIAVSAQFNPSPAHVAELFWNMGSDEQADFFAELWRLSAGKLCLQTAWVVVELMDRADKGDRAGLDAFQTMLAHAQDYPEAAAEWRASRAKSAIADLARAARTEPQS